MEVSENFARFQVSSALWAQNQSLVDHARNVLADGYILEYRHMKKNWEGLFSLLFKDNEDLTTYIDRGLSKFQSMSVEKYRILMYTATGTKTSPDETCK